jgi:hypothetical protein
MFLRPCTTHSDCPTATILYLVPLLLSISTPLRLPDKLHVLEFTGIQRLIHSDLSFSKYQCVVQVGLAGTLSVL